MHKDYTSDPHSQRFHEQQEVLLLRFRAIQARLLAGYEGAAREARIQMQDENPLVASYAAVRASWNERAADELRERMVTYGRD